MKIILPVVIIALTLSVTSAHSQSTDATCASYLSGKIKHGLEFKFQFYGASRTGGSGGTLWQNGYGVSASLQFKTIDYLSVYFGIDIAQLKLVEKSETYPSYVVSDKLTPASSVNIGIRVYPFKDEYPVFAKFGIDVMFRKSSVNKNAVVVPPFTGELGLGYEFRLSEKINLFPEINNVFVNDASEIHFGAGVSVIL